MGVGSSLPYLRCCSTSENSTIPSIKTRPRKASVDEDEEAALAHSFLHVSSSTLPRHRLKSISGASVPANATTSRCILRLPYRAFDDFSRKTNETGRKTEAPRSVVGKAGEDRAHVVVAEEERWMFVGIYDGFNGPDAAEFLVGHLYKCVFEQLEGVLWEEDAEFRRNGEFSVKKAELSYSERLARSFSRLRNGIGSCRLRFPSWWIDCTENGIDEEDLFDRPFGRRIRACDVMDHELVLEALARALEITERKFLDLMECGIDRNPELAIMGSCVMVVLMRGEDVYLLNLGDSRVVVAQSKLQEENQMNVREPNRGSEELAPVMELGALQLSVEHSIANAEEVQRIKEEHPDDPRCIVNGKVKGRLRVTRAFGVGYLKQPKWNNGLLKVFRNKYIGTAPYISCSPFLYHYKIGSSDRFLIFSSDGIYQYMTNEEVVSHVNCFLEKFPDGDPAQSLVEELLLRAARKAGMDLHQLLEIPQGDRRKFHDDVTVMVISLGGRIWESFA